MANRRILALIIEDKVKKIDISVKLAGELKKKCQRDRISLENLLRKLYGLYGRVDDNVVKEYLWVSE